MMNVKMMNVNAMINNATESEVEVLRLMFGERIKIAEVAVAKTGNNRKSAPRKTVKAAVANSDEKIAATKETAKSAKKIKAEAATKETTETTETTETKVTRAEALTAKYGDIDVRRHYIEVRRRVEEELADEVRKTGKRYPYKEWLKMRNERTNAIIAEEKAKAEAEAKTATKRRGRKPTKKAEGKVNA